MAHQIDAHVSAMCRAKDSLKVMVQVAGTELALPHARKCFTQFSVFFEVTLENITVFHLDSPVQSHLSVSQIDLRLSTVF